MGWGGGVAKSLLQLLLSNFQKTPSMAEPPYFTPLTLTGGSEVSSLNVSTGQLSFLPSSSKLHRVLQTGAPSNPPFKPSFLQTAINQPLRSVISPWEALFPVQLLEM